MELKRILLVDDEEAFLFLSEYFLRNCNIQCPIDMAYSAQEGLDKISGNEPKPQLILLDMHMPGLNGLDFLEAFSKMPESEHTKVFVLSSSSLESEKTASMAYKCVHCFIDKPLNNPVVQHILKHFSAVSNL